MNRAMNILLAGSLMAGASTVRAAGQPEYDVDLTLTNKFDKDFTDLPVLVQVFRVFGRGVDYARFNPKGFHVYDQV